MLVHQWSDLRRIRFPSHTTVFLIVLGVSVVPIITRFTVRLAGTGYVLDPAHVLSAG